MFATQNPNMTKALTTRNCRDIHTTNSDDGRRAAHEQLINQRNFRRWGVRDGENCCIGVDNVYVWFLSPHKRVLVWTTYLRPPKSQPRMYCCYLVLRIRHDMTRNYQRYGRFESAPTRKRPVMCVTLTRWHFSLKLCFENCLIGPENLCLYLRGAETDVWYVVHYLMPYIYFEVLLFVRVYIPCRNTGHILHGVFVDIIFYVWYSVDPRLDPRFVRRGY